MKEFKLEEVKIKWLIYGVEDYFVGEDNKLYCNRNLRVVPMVMKKYTKGFYLNRKFYSLVYLRKCLIRIATQQ
jgi:hypothetical protein